MPTIKKFAEREDPWADFLSWQKLLAALLLEKKEVMQELVANILLIISIVKLSWSVFCYNRKARLRIWLPACDSDFQLIVNIPIILGLE